MTIYDDRDQHTQVADSSLLANFPPGFAWGASTSAYQIEGATREDNRGRSIWDDFAATPGKTFGGETGDIANDHYHLMAADLELMSRLGLKSYCFSIAWPRILPQGVGTLNEPGLDFYQRLVDALLEKGIEPVAKLYHWDLPSALQDRGGWLNRDTALAFADYADLVSQRLGDRVSCWITHNEPFCTSYLGHVLGIHAPGLTDPQIGIDASHHVLLSHGLAVPRLRANIAPTARVGISLDYYPIYPINDDPETLQAATQADVFRNRWFFDPIFKGEYPAGLFECLGVTPPPVQDGDMQLISAPLDFLGLNYYTRWLVRRLQDEQSPKKEHRHQIYEQVLDTEEMPVTEMDWEIFPEGLLNALERIQRDYAPPAIFIAENGASFTDNWDGSATVCDPQRTDYLHTHIQSVGQAIAKGVPVQGYFVWSLMDNYEWSLGYSKRFGIVYVDFATQQRIVKDSGYWYASLLDLAANDRSS